MAQKTIVVDERELDEVLEALGKAQAELVYRLRNLYAARVVEDNPGASRHAGANWSQARPQWFSQLVRDAFANVGPLDSGGLDPGDEGCADDPLAWPFFETTPIRTIGDLETDLQNLMKARDVLKKMLSQP